MDRKFRINEALKNETDEHVEVVPIIQPAEFMRSAEPSITHGILIKPPDC